MNDLLQDPAPETVPARPRRVLRIALILLATGALSTGGAAAYAIWAMGGSPGEPIQVIVPEGATGQTIAALLEEKGVVRSAFMFRLVARVRGVATDLKPGAYELQAGMGVQAAIDRLRVGVPVPVVRFTIPEGKTVGQIAEIVAGATGVSRRAFLRATTNGRHRIDIMPKRVTSLEGLLFPKTYDIVEGTSAGEIVAMLLAQFEAEVADIDFSRARAAGLSPYETIVIASLIEREARLADERRTVSSVIYNRIRVGMRLQIDATIQYVILQRTGEVKDPLTYADLEIESPYNTYRVNGLPPTPIAAPGLASIQAAANPRPTDYFFYRLVDPSGRHCFSKDAAGHAECGRKAQ